MNSSISSKKKRGYIDENATVESSDEDSGINLSELENTIKSLKNSSSNEGEGEGEDEGEEIENNVVGRKFIKKALGLSENINIKETEDEEDEEDEDFLLEEEEDE